MTRFRWRGPPRGAPAVIFAFIWLASAACAGPPGAASADSAPGSTGVTAAAGSTEHAPLATLEQIREWNMVGRIADAERASRILLAETERARGPESAEVAEVLDELAVAMRRGGKTSGPEFLQVCERAVSVKERAFGRKDPRFATSLHNLGMLYYVRQDYARALPLLEETLEIREGALGSNHPDLAKTLLALGALQHGLGNLEQARALTERGVSIEEIALGPANPSRALGLNSLACLQYATGDFAESIPNFEEAIELWERSQTPNEGEIATCLHNLGAVYESLGDHGRAAQVLERAARIRERERGAGDVLLANTLIVLAGSYHGLGDHGRAKAACLRAVDIATAADPPRPAELGWALTKLGWSYLQEGDLEAAGDALQRGLRSQEEALGPDHNSLWLALRYLAMVAGSQGEAEKARTYYKRAVEILRKTSGHEHPDLGVTLAEYASFQLTTGDSLAALNTALQAAEINHEHLRLTVGGITERQALVYTSDTDTGMDVALDAVSGALGFQPREIVGRVWDSVVRARAMVLDEVAGRARSVEGAEGVSEAARRLEAARSRLANLLVRRSTDGAPERSAAQIARAREDVERSERALAARSASFRRGSDRASIGLDRVLSALPPGSALLAIVCHGRGPARSYIAFVAGIDRSPRAVPLGAADGIDHLIARWRKLAASPPEAAARLAVRAETACRSAGDSLRARVWDPVAKLIVGARMVFVVPDGQFHLLNLSALPAADGGYLVESSLLIHYASAERDIASMEGVRPRGAGLLALGSVAFDKPERRARPAPLASSPPDAQSDERIAQATAYRAALAECVDFRSVRFNSLPQTGLEVDEIGELWGRPAEAVILKGEAAGERAVKELLPGRRVAHFATHGFFLDARCAGRRDASHAGARAIGGIATEAQADPNPHPVTPRPDTPRPAVGALLVSGLAFAGANLRSGAGPGEEDGILTAEEIASLDLSGLDWAVLSACDTGVGEIQSGEGVFGLRRAFEIAGAGTLIMSLWPVEDRSTREWMRNLYEGRFRRNLATAEAVREADLSVLQSLRARGLSTHPFYWAAFVAAGGWR